MSFEIDLSGRRALVTGAGQHVGRAIARSLASAGAEVAVNDIVTERAESVVAEIQAEGGKAMSAVFDVTAVAEAGPAIESVAADILVNNVGNTGAGNKPGAGAVFAMDRFLESDPKDWNATFNVNLLGVMNCTRSALPAMVDREWGRVITIVSDASRVPERRMAAYSAAKAGAAGFSRAVAAEFGRSGVTANCVSLGTIQSEHMIEAMKEAEPSEQMKKALKPYLLPRLGTPNDPAALVVFLASDLAGWITAQTYPVNGGYSPAL